MNVISHPLKSGPATDAKHIRSAPALSCCLCGRAGQLLYSGQPDRLFGAAGSWNLKQCSNRVCGLIWLDPMPLAEDIGKAYASYYTHAEQIENDRAGILKRIYGVMKRGYLRARYNYQTAPRSAVGGIMGKLLYLFPLRRAEVDAEVRFLPSVPGGRLLDVGCGSGEWLSWMRDLGWQVEGVDSDESANRIARQQGLVIHRGRVEQQRFPDNSFDAVTLNHVIEHVSDPVGTLAECCRILKKGGKLYLATPNSSSLGHRLFKQDWRGLEPPRHLHIFDPRSMAGLLDTAGLGGGASIRTINSSYMWQHSFKLWRGGSETAPNRGRRMAAQIATSLLTFLGQVLPLGRANSGEWMAVEAVKS
jgi:2-polyprenyl-3-methyl-5-hydroxy-6-metoxy-1,4-benzoquinol methylase